MIGQLVFLYIAVKPDSHASLLDFPEGNHSTNVALVDLRGLCSGYRIQASVTLYGCLELVVTALGYHVGVCRFFFTQVYNLFCFGESEVDIGYGASFHHNASVGLDSEILLYAFGCDHRNLEAGIGGCRYGDIERGRVGAYSHSIVSAFQYYRVLSRAVRVHSCGYRRVCRHDLIHIRNTSAKAVGFGIKVYFLDFLTRKCGLQVYLDQATNVPELEAGGIATSSHRGFRNISGNIVLCHRISGGA